MDDTFTIRFDLSIGYISYKFIKNADDTYHIIRTQYVMNCKKTQGWKHVSSKIVAQLKREFMGK